MRLPQMYPPTGSAAFSGFLLASISLVAPLPLMALSFARMPEAYSTAAPLGYTILLLLATACAAFSCVPFARFLLRVNPPGFPNPPQRGSILLLTLSCVFMSVQMFGVPILAIHRLTAPSLILEVVSPSGPRATPEALSVSTLRRISLGTPLFVSVLLPSLICIWRNMKAKKLLDRSFVLFLRRFSGFSDLSGLSAVLRASPAGIPVVLLVEQQEDPFARGNWDPLVIGFAGLSILRPLQSIPLFLLSNNEEWEDAVARLVSQAACILIDVTDKSKSIDTEISIIANLARSSDAIHLEELKAPTESVDDRTPRAMEDHGIPIVSYYRSVPEALPRIGVGFSLFLLLVLLVNLTWPRTPLDERSGVVSMLLWLDSETTKFLLWPYIIVSSAILFARPVVAGESIHRLRMAISGVLSRRVSA